MCRDIYVALPLKRHKCRGAYFQNKNGRAFFARFCLQSYIYFIL